MAPSNLQPSGDKLTEGDIRDRLSNQLLTGLYILGIVGLPASLVRMTTTGWLPVYAVHAVLTLLLLCVYGYQHRLSTTGKAVVITALTFAVAGVGLLTFGFYGAGVVWVTISCMVANIFFSRRVAIGVTTTEILVLLAIAMAFTQGILGIAFDANDYIRQVDAWVGVLTGTLVGVLTLVFGVRVYNDSIHALLAEVQQQRNQIQYQATHDALTGLPTLRLLIDRCAMAIHLAQRNGSKCAVLFIDLDGFKDVNDRFGHEAGDCVLREVSARLLGSLRATDTAARLGGDEFLVVLTALDDPLFAGEVADKIIRSLGVPIHIEGTPMQIGASIGISIFPDHAQDFSALKKAADMAMYAVKKSGKNRFAFATAPDPASHPNA